MHTYVCTYTDTHTGEESSHSLILTRKSAWRFLWNLSSPSVPIAVCAGMSSTPSVTAWGHVYICMYMYVYVCICMCVWRSTCMYAHIIHHIHMFVYVHIQKHRNSCWYVLYLHLTNIYTGRCIFDKNCVGSQSCTLRNVPLCINHSFGHILWNCFCSVGTTLHKTVREDTQTDPHVHEYIRKYMCVYIHAYIHTYIYIYIYIHTYINEFTHTGGHADRSTCAWVYT
jgi:hypothetical protein